MPVVYKMSPTLKDRTGNVIAGCESLAFAGSGEGNYTGTIPSDADLANSTEYDLFVHIAHGSQNMAVQMRRTAAYITA